MRYTVVFIVLAAALVVDAVFMEGLAWLLLWPAGSFVLVAIAYALNAPNFMGKRPSGRFAWWAVVLYLPYFLLTWSVWHLQRWTRREPAYHEVAGMWLSRRLLAHEVPAGITCVVDLTSEFPEPRGVRAGRRYVNVPILDGMSPTLPQLQTLVSIVNSEERVLIHCAVGHGRTGLLAVAVLLQRGLAPDVRRAVQIIRAIRPGVRLNPSQRRCAEQFAATLNQNR